MIEFLTVFIGFFTGIHTVELDVGPRVASVEVMLDGRQIGILRGEPWSVACDFGSTLEPHDLDAIAFDSQRQKLQRIHQEVNYTSAAPSSGETSEAMTSVVISLDSKASLPSPHEMDGWFVSSGEPLVVVEADKGPAEIIVVIEPTAHPTLNALADSFLETMMTRMKDTTGEGLNTDLDPAITSRWVDIEPDLLPDQQAVVLSAAQTQLREFARLDASTGVRFLSPLAAPPSRVPTAGHVFRARRMSADAGGFLWLTERASTSPLSLRVADSVAVAASTLHSSGRRRAVVVVLADDDREDSFYPPAQVRGYLDCLQVPLHVWTITPNQQRLGWGAMRHIGPPSGRAEPEVRVHSYLAAVDNLRRSLDRQRVLWLAGRHLPQHVDLGRQAEGIRLVASHTIGLTESTRR